MWYSGFLCVLLHPKLEFYEKKQFVVYVCGVSLQCVYSCEGGGVVELLDGGDAGGES